MTAAGAQRGARTHAVPRSLPHARQVDLERADLVVAADGVVVDDRDQQLRKLQRVLGEDAHGVDHEPLVPDGVQLLAEVVRALLLVQALHSDVRVRRASVVAAVLRLQVARLDAAAGGGVASGRGRAELSGCAGGGREAGALDKDVEDARRRRRLGHLAA